MTKLIVIVATLLAICFLADAQGRKPAPAESKETAGTEKTEKPVEIAMTAGLFSVGHQEKDWYFDIPDALLGRRMLAVTRYTSQTPGAGTYGGEQVNEVMVYWEKAVNGNLLLRADVIDIQAAED